MVMLIFFSFPFLSFCNFLRQKSGGANITDQAQLVHLQSSFSGSNTFGTMKISSRQGYFEPMRVDFRRLNRNIFLIFFNRKVSCVFLLESPLGGDSNEYT